MTEPEKKKEEQPAENQPNRAAATAALDVLKYLAELSPSDEDERSVHVSRARYMHLSAERKELLTDAKAMQPHNSLREDVFVFSVPKLEALAGKKLADMQQEMGGPTPA